MNKNELLENTCNAISLAWQVSHQFDSEGDIRMAKKCWADLLENLDGMRSMANWCMDDTEVYEWIQELMVIARMHNNRVITAYYKGL